MIVRELIAIAYYLGGIVARRYETIDGTQSTDGFRILKNILQQKSANGNEIPYYQHTQIAATANVGEYLLEGFVMVEDTTFNISTVRYPAYRVSRDVFWSTARAENVSALPFIWYTERVLDGIKLYVYFNPTAQIDFFTVTGKAKLSDITQDTEMDTIMDDYYQVYLQYELASWLCDFNQRPFPASSEMRLRKVRKDIQNLNPPDMSSIIVNVFDKDDSINYPQINLSPGWVP